MELPIVEYDRFGRIKYNPAFHTKHKTPWSMEDLQYLVNWYDIIGPEEMSFALERPVTAIQQKVTVLRRQGYMKKPDKFGYHRRIKKELRQQP
ncbi:hypothetical protein [Clostridium thermopalmarium]|uniref:Uncharacterized protein n=1 Tax=Clostridium thermopalmarium DSM 5974 TaxID=1121340 RepID=A0A2T0APH0_9CLOT|nr:hypothetical protein [Clostridium thermopalmarium]PRR70883.1 hypothetical protein CPAL_19730 [Clostridium thermopalmarium DSM 5974]PVZ28807.1 hypothetical protein LX19_00111 [Clostridium thermopalmarium DSM 5974]